MKRRWPWLLPLAPLVGTVTTVINPSTFSIVCLGISAIFFAISAASFLARCDV